MSDVDVVLPGDTIMVALPAFDASQAFVPSEEGILRQADLLPVLPEPLAHRTNACPGIGIAY